jgi:hypothetical protein
MSRVIVIEFVTLDGVTQDPDGNEGFGPGGWAFRFGPEAVTGDPFRLGALLDTGALLLGRRTWPPGQLGGGGHAVRDVRGTVPSRSASATAPPPCCGSWTR